MASTINATSANIAISADGSGVLALQNNGTTALTLNTSGALGVGSTPSYGTSGQVLISGGSSAQPTWGSVIADATNLAGGAAGKVPYQSAVDTTSFTAVGTSGQVLVSGGTGSPTWTTNIAGNAANVTGTVAVGNGGTGLTSLTANYIPYGNGTSAFSSSANYTFNGTNLTLGTAGVGSLFQGDFSNATLLNRTSFQTGTTNTSTGIYALPNGTSTAASWQATNNSNPTNASKILIATNGSTDVQLVSGINGTGTYLPLAIYNGGVGTFVFGTSGQFGIGPTASVNYGTSGQVLTSGGASAAPTWTTPVSLNGANTWTNTQTFNGSTSVFGAATSNIVETTNIVAGAINATPTAYFNTGAVQFYTSTAGANWTQNLSFSSGTTLNSALAIGQSATIAIMATQGATAYYMNGTLTIDGSSSGVTTRWQGGTAPTTGNASGIDVYTYSVTKTASATYIVLASLTQFK